MLRTARLRAAPPRPARAHFARAALALLLLGLALAGPASETRAQADPAQTVDECMRAEMASRGVHGGQIAVARDGRILLERAYGSKHREREEPVDVHTQFRIGSTTKVLTAFAMMQLVDEGLLDLDAPITDYLEDFSLAEPGQAEAITVRDLLKHSSGLHDTSAFDESDLFGPTDPGAMRRWVDEQVGQAPYAPPGRFWNYSSANYMYAGQILERISGLGYPDYMDQRVFGPAGMADSTMHAAKGVARGNFAYGHYRNPFSGQNEIYDLDDNDNWARHPTGYANATASDLVRFASLLMAEGGDLLSAESRAEMQSRQQHRDLRADQFYGLGTFVEIFGGREMVHHDGGAWGWTATLKWLPDEGLAVATTSNVSGALLHGATSCALTAYAPPLPDPAPPCRLDRGAWSAWVGRYEGSLNTGQRWAFDVSRPDPTGSLQLRVLREGEAPLEGALSQDCGIWTAEGPGSFQAEALNARITFVADGVEPGVAYLRHRFFSGRREAPSPTSTPTPSALPTASASPTPDSLPTSILVLPWLGRE